MKSEDMLYMYIIAKCTDIKSASSQLASNLLASWTCHRGMLKLFVGCKLNLCYV